MQTIRRTVQCLLVGQFILGFTAPGQMGEGSPPEKIVPVYNLQSEGPPGSYWSLQLVQPPLPYDPFPELEVFVLDATNHIYVINDLNVDYPALLALMDATQAPPSPNHLAKGGTMNVLKASESGDSSPALSYSNNDLWLELVQMTNTTAWFVVHPPEIEFSNSFDLYLTTTLGLNAPGLNGTNWQWVLRSEAGQTNLVVSNLPADGCFFRLGRTNDDDGDGLSTAFEKLVSHSDPIDGDQNTNGIPDGWEWNYFGNLNQAAADDYDSDGIINFWEYQGATDPNKIVFSFSVTNRYVNSSSVPVQLNVTRGIPFNVAVLVDNTNLADATWTAYSSSNLIVNPGYAEGWHQLRIGLRGRLDSSKQTWMWKRLKVDRTPPMLMITNPASLTVSQPMIQVQGFFPERLDVLTCDLTNANGSFSNQMALVIDQHYDTNTWEFTTNYIQVVDVELANGANTLTFHATDLAGNVTTTNVTFTLDYSGKTNPPAMQLYWPQNGTWISGSNYTWRGRVDDFTAKVTATLVSTNGATNEYEAIVERDGRFWIENLPAPSGTNGVQLTAIDVIGNVSVTNVTVIKSPVTLTLATVPSVVRFDQTFVPAYCTIDSTNYTVWINGVKAQLISPGQWFAPVPVTPGGTAVFQARAIPNDDNGGNGSGGSSAGGGGSAGSSYAADGSTGNPESPQTPDIEIQSDKPNTLYIESYENSEHFSAQSATTSFFWIHDSNSHDVSTHYDYGSGGKSTVYNSGSSAWSAFVPGFPFQNAGGVDYWRREQTIWPNENGGATLTVDSDFLYQDGTDVPEHTVNEQAVPPPAGAEHCETNGIIDYDHWAPDGSTHAWYHYDVSQNTQGKLKYFTGGKGVPEEMSLYSIQMGGMKLPEGTPQEVRLLGSSDGSFRSLGDGMTLDLTPTSSADHYRFWPEIGVITPYITANGIDLRTQTPEFCVGQKVTFSVVWSPAQLLGIQSITAQWKFDGTFVNRSQQGFHIIGDTFVPGSLNYEIAPELLTHENTAAWWTSGGFNPPKFTSATIGESIALTNGKNAIIRATGKFKIFKPSIQFSSFPPYEVHLVHAGNLGYPCIRLGQEDTSRSMAFAADIESRSQFPGQAKATQLANIWYSRLLLGQVTTTGGTDGSFWLDGDPYPNSSVNIDYIPASSHPPAGPCYVTDAPFVSLQTSSWASINDQFKTYIRFRPYGDDNIWVTLGRVGWNWFGNADLTGSNSFDLASWTLTSSGVGGPTFLVTDEFPFWDWSL